MLPAVVRPPLNSCSIWVLQLLFCCYCKQNLLLQAKLVAVGCPRWVCYLQLQFSVMLLIVWHTPTNSPSVRLLAWSCCLQHCRAAIAACAIHSLAMVVPLLLLLLLRMRMQMWLVPARARASWSVLVSISPP